MTKVVPHVIREQLIFKRDSFGVSDEVEGWIREKARQLLMYGGKNVPAHSLETKGALVQGLLHAEVLAVVSARSRSALTATRFSRSRSSVL